MGRYSLVLTAAVLGLTLAGCARIDRAVKGFQAAPGWTMVGESSERMGSDVEYLGASADGLIVVAMPDGTTQIWGAGR